ncbi:hypothetical protein [Hymenobacter cellulosilyticus]|uniref:Viral A-type inclusion protein n=1 Tax=Hymenobacter cellulosilyticus TaxID=2932248 RepID=A0A8T9Q0C0_9BACT|nr:hypothetical protein [Hymenobacter cellulosilyticus]UOQ71216.1 hypothetical protein MUN79_21570 [Hymenobacter cellulosilyticus]
MTYLCRVFTFRPSLLLAVGCAALVAACSSGPNEQQQVEAAEKAVLASHDTLMAQMGQLYDLRQQLQKAPGPDTVLAGRQRRSLLRADAAMMGWMHQYRKPADSVATEAKLRYFAGQQQKIDSVGRLMRQNLDSAKLVLQLATPAANSSAQ